MKDLPPDEGFAEKPVARGIAGRSLAKTPAVEGAKRGHMECDINVDSLAYWNDPQGDRDRNFKSPFAVKVSRLHSDIDISFPLLLRFTPNN